MATVTVPEKKSFDRWPEVFGVGTDINSIARNSTFAAASRSSGAAAERLTTAGTVMGLFAVPFIVGTGITLRNRGVAVWKKATTLNDTEAKVEGAALTTIGSMFTTIGVGMASGYLASPGKVPAALHIAPCHAVATVAGHVVPFFSLVMYVLIGLKSVFALKYLSTFRSAFKKAPNRFSFLQEQIRANRNGKEFEELARRIGEPCANRVRESLTKSLSEQEKAQLVLDADRENKKLLLKHSILTFISLIGMAAGAAAVAALFVATGGAGFFAAIFTVAAATTWLTVDSAPIHEKVTSLYLGSKEEATASPPATVRVPVTPRAIETVPKAEDQTTTPVENSETLYERLIRLSINGKKVALLLLLASMLPVVGNSNN